MWAAGGWTTMPTAIKFPRYRRRVPRRRVPVRYAHSSDSTVLSQLTARETHRKPVHGAEPSPAELHRARRCAAGTSPVPSLPVFELLHVAFYHPISVMAHQPSLHKFAGFSAR